MADTPALTPQDYDPWQLATPLQLLTLLERLDVPMSEVARWLRVPRSSVSMWRHGTRAIPPKHIPALRTWARLALDQAAELTDKAVSLAPTEDLRAALRTDFAAIWTRWKQEVLADAGTLERSMQANYQALGTWLARESLTGEDQESIALLLETLRTQVALRVQLQGTVPDAEATLHARLTEAHEAAAPIVLTAEERAAAEADLPAVRAPEA
jgi:hypothetical protein